MTWNKEEVNEMQTQKIRKNHMDILWHEYTEMRIFGHAQNDRYSVIY